MCYLVHLTHLGDLKRRGDVIKPSNPYVIPVTSRGCFGVGLCLVLGMFQTIICIPSERNVSKNNKNKLFLTILSRFDLAVTLR